MSDGETRNQPQISIIHQIAERLAICVEPTAILEMLDSGCQSVQELALAKLQTLMTQSDCSLELQSTLFACDEHIGVINAMTEMEPTSWTVGCNVGAMLRTAVRSATSAGQIAVARLICRKLPSQIPLLLEFLNMPMDPCSHMPHGAASHHSEVIIACTLMVKLWTVCVRSS